MTILEHVLEVYNKTAWIKHALILEHHQKNLVLERDFTLHCDLHARKIKAMLDIWRSLISSRWACSWRKTGHAYGFNVIMQMWSWQLEHGTSLQVLSRFLNGSLLNAQNHIYTEISPVLFLTVSVPFRISHLAQCWPRPIHLIFTLHIYHTWQKTEERFSLICSTQSRTRS